MGNVFSLDSFKEQADKEYKAFQIRVNDVVVTLNNPIRIPQANRERLFDIIPQLNTGDEGTKPEDLKVFAPLLLEVLELVGDDEVGRLIEDVRDDLPLMLSIFQAYFKEVGLGEA